MDERARGRVLDGLLVLLLAAVALVPRFAPYPAATARGWRLLSPDCYGHLRRTVSVARNFPRIPVRDPYLNHPDGGVFIWPPAFDLAAGGAARLVYGSEARDEDVLRVAASLPPVLGALQVVPLFFLARRLFGRRRAVAAALAYAVLPAAAVWGGFGHFDQHVAEALNLLLVLAAGARAAAGPPGGRAARAAVFGAAIALAVLTWQGAVFVAALALVWAAFAIPEAAGLAAATAAALAAAGTAAALPKEPVPFTFVSFGWFQPLLLAALAVPLLLLSAYRATERRRRLVLAGAAALALVAVLPHAGDLATAALRGGSYVLKSGASGDEVGDGGFLSYPADFLRLVAESQPLVTSGASFLRAVRELSPGFLLVPFAAAAWAWPALRGRRNARASGRVLVALFATAVFVMALFQLRNVYYLAVFAALALAELCARLLPRRLPHRSRALAAAALALLLVLVPGGPALARTRAYASAPGYDVLDLFARLRALDPPPVDPARVPAPAPGSIPGVMAPWSAGHFVTQIAGRPAAADPFFYGWRRQCRLFTATDDAEAFAILAGARCRYLVTADLTPLLPVYAAAAGRAPAPTAAMFVRRVHESDAERPVPFLVRVLDARTGSLRTDGTFQPRFRVFRVESP